MPSTLSPIEQTIEQHTGIVTNLWGRLTWTKLFVHNSLRPWLSCCMKCLAEGSVALRCALMYLAKSRHHSTPSPETANCLPVEFVISLVTQQCLKTVETVSSYAHKFRSTVKTSCQDVFLFLFCNVWIWRLPDVGWRMRWKAASPTILQEDLYHSSWSVAAMKATPIAFFTSSTGEQAELEKMRIPDLQSSPKMLIDHVNPKETINDDYDSEPKSSPGSLSRVNALLIIFTAAKWNGRMGSTEGRKWRAAR